MKAVLSGPLRILETQNPTSPLVRTWFSDLVLLPGGVASLTPLDVVGDLPARPASLSPQLRGEQRCGRTGTRIHRTAYPDAVPIHCQS